MICGDAVEDVLRRGRLRWFGHVELIIGFLLVGPWRLLVIRNVVEAEVRKRGGSVCSMTCGV